MTHELSTEAYFTAMYDTKFWRYIYNGNTNNAYSLSRIIPKHLGCYKD
jgi:hypothetical protein